MFALPLNDTPCIVLAVCNVVAVAALPVVSAVPVAEITPVLELYAMVEPSPLIKFLTLVLNPDKSDAVICEPFTFICPPLVKFKLPFTNTSFDVPPVFKKMFEPDDSN